MFKIEPNNTVAQKTVAGSTGDEITTIVQRGNFPKCLELICLKAATFATDFRYAHHNAILNLGNNLRVHVHISTFDRVYCCH